MLESYPDIHNQLLIDAISKFHDIDPECIAVANGSTELIYWLPRALGVSNALVVLPTFGEYAKAFELQGTRLQKLFSTPENSFQPKVEQLEAALRKDPFEAVLLTHPASPSGSLLDSEVISWVFENSNQSGSPFFLVDEVFIDFCRAGFPEAFPGQVSEPGPHKVSHQVLRPARLADRLPDRAAADCRKGPEPSSALVGKHSGPGCGRLVFYAGRIQAARPWSWLQKNAKGLRGSFQLFTVSRFFRAQANYLLVRMDRNLKPASRLKWDILNATAFSFATAGPSRGLTTGIFAWRCACQIKTTG